MFYIIGVFRRTALWAMLLTILGSVSMKELEMLYMLVTFGAAYLFFCLYTFTRMQNWKKQSLSGRGICINFRI